MTRESVADDPTISDTSASEQAKGNTSASEQTKGNTSASEQAKGNASANTHLTDKDEPIEHYDYLIIGTGLAESALSSILTTTSHAKILHIDTGSTYGSDFSTLNFTQLLSHFKHTNSQPDSIDANCMAKDRQFNIDLTPKLLLHDSPMKDFLLDNQIHEIVSFTSIKASYLYTDRLHSVPTNEAQSMKTSALGFMEKCRVVKFFWNARKYHDNRNMEMKKTMLEEFKSFGLSLDSIDFIGHAVALNLDDNYLMESPAKTYERILRYAASIVSYNGTESPYIYPLYGLSELCQAFVRKSALEGTIFMLHAKIEEISEHRLVITDPNGDRHVVSPRKIIADPKYWPDSTVSKEIIRCIMLLRKGTLESRNIIFLKRHLGRQNDVFCVVLGADECTCPEEYEMGIISTVRERTCPPEDEIRGVLERFDVIRSFTEVRQVFTNTDRGNVYFTRNVDESALLDNIYEDIRELCEKLGVSN